MAEYTTYRELVYMIKDLLKDASDDSHFTEDHIVFLINKYRSMFIRKYYKEESKIPENLKQTICLDLERCVDCMGDKETLRSIQSIPELIGFENNVTSGIDLSLGDYYSNYRLSFVSFQRFPFTNSNRFLKNIVYIAMSPDRKLNINIEGNMDAAYLEAINLTGVFEDPSKAAEYSCNQQQKECDPLDRNIYLDNSLQAIIIKAILQDLSYGLYKPKDNLNNAKDDLSNNSVDNYLRSQSRNNYQNNRKDREDRREREEE